MLGAATFPLSPSGLRQQLALPHAAPARARGERQESAACLAKFPNAICKRLRGHGQARARLGAGAAPPAAVPAGCELQRGSLAHLALRCQSSPVDRPLNRNGGKEGCRGPWGNAGFRGGRGRAEALPPGDGSPGWMRRGGLQHPLPLPQQQHPNARSKSLLCLPCLAGLSAGRAVLAAPRCLDAHKPPARPLVWQRCRRRVEIAPCSARCARGRGLPHARAHGFPSGAS